MTSLFAQQFDAVAPYEPGPLRTGEPEIGLTLPSSKTKPRAPEEKVPAKVPSKAVAGGAASLAAAGAAEAAAGKSANATVGASATNSARGNASISKHMALDAQADANAAIPTTGGVSAPLTTKTSGANVAIPSPEWGIKQTQMPAPYQATATSPKTLAPATPAPAPRGGFLGTLENWGSSITNQVDHAMYSPNSGAKPVDAYEQAQYNRHFGTTGTYSTSAPTASGVSAAAAGGAVQGLSSGTSINKTKDSGVTEPANVWNPSGSGNGTSAPYSTSGSSAIPGVSSPSALSGAVTPKAISPYNYNDEFDKLMNENGMSQSPRSGSSRLVNPVQFSNAVRSYGTAEGLAQDQADMAEIEALEEAASA